MKIIGICGPSGSGKSTVADLIAKKLDAEIIHADAFFKSELPTMVSPEDGKEYPDWNSPDSVRYGEIASILRGKKENGGRGFLIVEGLLIFAVNEICGLIDSKIFVYASPETCLYRRIVRNMSLFGMSVQEIGEYYLKCARYREREYCLPHKNDADYLLENETDCTEEINVICDQIRRKI